MKKKSKHLFCQILITFLVLVSLKVFGVFEKVGRITVNAIIHHLKSRGSKLYDFVMKLKYLKTTFSNIHFITGGL